MRKERGYAGANQLSLRRGNRSVVYRVVWMFKRISRIELAAKTGLHPATITHIVDELITEGLLKESGSAEISIGRPALQLEINPDVAYIVGVNVTRDSVSAALIDLSGQVSQEVSFAGLQVRNDNKYLINRLSQSIEIILEDAVQAGRNVIGIGIGAPERNYLSSHLVTVSASGESQDQTLSEILAERFDLPVVVDHNANTLALDLQYFGEIGDISNFVLLRCGFGIGGSVVINHEIYYGSHLSSSEFGHLTVDTSGERCRCGNWGCLELYSSIPAILARTALDLGLSASTLSVEQVADAYKAGHPGVVRSVKDISKYMANAVTTIVNSLTPDAVFIGGALGALAPIFAQLVHEQIEERIYPTLRNQIPVIGVSQAAGPVRGAAMLIIRNVINTASLDFASAPVRKQVSKAV
ncbi:MAG TPA: ROK family protein [Chloroflexia bacterium]|nr:ROK family protein [Chloroflexia bacterium]